MLSNTDNSGTLILTGNAGLSVFDNFEKQIQGTGKTVINNNVSLGSGSIVNQEIIEIANGSLKGNAS